MLFFQSLQNAPYQWLQKMYLNFGILWMLGGILSIYIIQLAMKRRTRPDGVIPFCRSMGAPPAEDFMFSVRFFSLCVFSQ
jgi:hypothetical protein